MIREILPDCGGQESERSVSMYKMWHCFDCGLEFSMKTREKPKCCPRCKVIFEDEQTANEGLH